LNKLAGALIVFLSITVLLGIARAGESSSCPYCGHWKPLSGHRFLSADALIVRRDQVALPGCDAAKATFLQEQALADINAANGLPPALLVYFRLEESPRCSPSLRGVEAGALLELRYVPTRTTGAGEVEVRVLHVREIPTRERTDSSAQWFAIRFDNK
jgi:hypothetical protein